MPNTDNTIYGFSWVKENLDLSSSYGTEAFNGLKPATSKDQNALKKTFAELSLLAEYFKNNSSLSDEMQYVIKKIRNIKGTLKNILSDLPLDEIELFEIKNFSLNFNSLAILSNKASLRLDSLKFVDLGSVVKILNPDKIITPSFYLHDAYSDKLKSLRAKRKLLEDSILKLEGKEKEQKRKERIELVALEEAESHKVRKKLSDMLKPYLQDLQDACFTIANLDLMIAKLKMAALFTSCQPELLNPTEADTVIIQEALHPQIASGLNKTNKTFTPVSISLKRGATLLTGANMGGKSVALMTVAFNLKLVSLGFFPFAKTFITPVFDFILFCGGDNANFNTGLSSFGAEIIQLDRFCKLTKTKIGFTAFDELARSTNPFEGSRFVQALCDYLEQTNSFALVSTHYEAIKLSKGLYYQVKGLKKDINPFFNLDKTKILANLSQQMDYSLLEITSDYKVPQDALKIAKIFNLDHQFLTYLKKYYEP